MYGYVYKRQNKINNKIYVGQHKYNKPELDERYRGSGHYFHNALLKYGEDSFTYELVDFAETKEELDELEAFYVVEFNSLAPNGYNLREGGNGKFCTPQSAAIISEKAKLRFEDEEYRSWFRARRKQWIKDHPEYCEYMSLIRRGEGNPMYGKHQTDKQKKAAAEGAKFERTPEIRNKLSVARKGKAPWNKGTKGGNNSGCGSYWITDGTIEGTKKWYDKYGPIPDGMRRGRTVPKRKN